ncbi:MAG: tRNA uridine-5-carboxymethylaminomethyl(34) synthesis GTPase MnmE [Spirochaetota bacterium]
MLNETICAPATAPGTGALSIIRISGPDTLRVVSSLFPLHAKLEPRRAVHGRLERDGAVIDDAVVTFYKEPSSFTGEDSAEICCHGNPLIVRDILRGCAAHGARMAEPGEFTKRAFLNGRIDLTEAEAINHIITARSQWEIGASLRQMHGSLRDSIHLLRDRLVLLKADIECSIDFSAEEIEFVSYGDAVRQIDEIEGGIRDIARRCAIGCKVSRGVDLPIVGKPNAGKSSILNMILNSERAIVSDIPGTTRDLIKETIQFGGVHINLIDTAGIREADSILEKIGIERSEQAIGSAGVILVVFDAQSGITDEDRAICRLVGGKKSIYLANKIDTAPDGACEAIARETGVNVIPFSARKGLGLEELEREATRIIRDEFTGAEDSFIADERILLLLDSAVSCCAQARENFEAKDPHEIAASSVQSLIEALGEITGEISADDVLNSVFSRFCVGK